MSLAINQHQRFFHQIYKRKRIFFHIAYWVCVVFLFTFLWGTRYNNYWVCFYNELVFLPIKLAVTYFGLCYLIPQLLFKEKYLRLGIMSLITMVLAGFIQRALVYISFIPLLGVSDQKATLFDITEILNHVLNINSVVIIPFAIKLYSYSLEKENRILSLSQEKMKAELQFLRCQIQPHFLFNVLNDLYGMALKKSDNTPEVILKLSELMRYMLQESTADFVSVEKEVNYIRNYIELEQLRYGKRFTVNFKVSGDTTGNSITPLLLLPFVENAFKHSTTNEIDKSWITVELNVDYGELQLKVANSYDPEAKKSQDVSSGIGIGNVQNRLNIIYPEKYTLQTDVTADTYTSILKINLKQ